jgi:hypothetical protein
MAVHHPNSSTEGSLMFKRGPRPLTPAELRQRKEAAAASAQARHKAETTPSVVQGSSGPPSRRAVGLFAQGRARPDARGGRGVWDTRTSEPTVGRINANVTLHFPQAYRSATPDPKAKGKLLAATLGQAKPRRRGRLTPHQDVVVTNPGTVEEAHRHQPMREIMQAAVEVVRGHQKPTIDRAHERKMIPEGTRPSTVVQAYRHAALHALHKAGLIDYAPKPMDQTTKRALRPLNRFMFYAHRRVFDHLNQGQLAQKWGPFRQEFGQLYRQKKYGKLTGVERMRMRPHGDRFIKAENWGDLEKAAFGSSLGRVARNLALHAGDLRHQPTAIGKTPTRPQIKRDLLRANALHRERLIGLNPHGQVTVRATGGFGSDHVGFQYYEAGSRRPKGEREWTVKTYHNHPIPHTALPSDADFATAKHQMPGVIYAPKLRGVSHYTGTEARVRHRGTETMRFSDTGAIAGGMDRAKAVRLKPQITALQAAHKKLRNAHARRFQALPVIAGAGAVAAGALVHRKREQAMKKAWSHFSQLVGGVERAIDRPLVRTGMGATGLGIGAAGYAHSRKQQAAQPMQPQQPMQPAKGLAPALPQIPTHLPIKHAAKHIEAHFRIPPIGGQTKKMANGLYRVVPDGDLRKIGESFTLGALKMDYDTDPARQLRRAIHPRMRVKRFKLRLNQQRGLRRALSGGITRKERWLLGATTKTPDLAFKSEALGKALGPHVVRAMRAARPYLTSFKDAVRDHARVLAGGTPSPHQHAVARRFGGTKTKLAGAAAAGYLLGHHQSHTFRAPPMYQLTGAIADDQQGM